MKAICKTALLAIVGMLIFLNIGIAKEGEWIRKADMPTARLDLSSAVVNEKIYAIGGSSAWNGKGLSVVEEYDPITDTWARKADMATGRLALSSIAINGKIYAIGGTDNIDFGGSSAVEEYDPISDKWTKKANMITRRWGLSTSVVNGKIYAIGGVQYPTPLAVVEEYDPISDKWIKKANMPTPRWYHYSSVVNGKIYVIGGTPNDFTTVYPIVEEYDPINDTWTKKSDMPTPRAAFYSNAVGGKIYAIGGSGKGNGLHNPIGNLEEYNPATDTGVKKTDMPTARFCLAAETLNGKIYAFGGVGLEYKAYSLVEEYDTGFVDNITSVNTDGKLTTTWGEIRRAK